MNVLLVAPKSDSYLKRDFFISPHFGLYRIYHVLRKRGFNVTFFDPNIDALKDILNKEFKIIAFSSYYQTKENDIKIAHKLKKKYSHAIFIAGGINATFEYADYLEYGPFDLVVLGEGEETFLEILSSSKLRNIPGLAYKQGDRIILTDCRDPLSKEKFVRYSFQFNFKTTPYQKYWQANSSFYKHPNDTEINTVRVFTSNYCPYGCRFCSSTNFLKYRYNENNNRRPPLVEFDSNQLFGYVKKILKENPKTLTVLFDDDSFLLHSERVDRFCELIIQEKKKGSIKKELTFICQSTINDLIRARKIYHDVLNRMSLAGFRMIMFGIESFDQIIQKDYRKKVSMKDAHEIVKSSLSAGITPLIYLIIFSKKTTLKSILLDIKNVGELGRSGCLISATPFMQYVPGSEMAKDKNLICTSKRVSINGKTLRKKEEILPDDDRTREAALKFLRNYRLQEAGFKNEIKHLPSTIRSLLNYRYVSKLFKKTEPVLDDLIEGYVKKMRN